MGKDCDRLDGHGGEGGGAISSSKSKRKKANGCMSAFNHLFHFQHFYFPCHHHHQHLTIDSSSKSRGLKLTEETPTSTTYKEKQLLNIPENIIRVRTETGTTSSRPRALVISTSTSLSEICNSPSSKTPNLVARLMGLDLLPDNHPLPNLHTMTHYGSNRLSSHVLSKKGSRSLPESPRISSSRKSDVDIHRLSLHLNRENHKHQEETRSPRDYARQVVKQIKERVVTRRVVGADITNSVKNREAGTSENSNELRRDTTVSCSPRSRFSDKENKPKTDSSLSFSQEQIIQKPKKMILVSVSKASGEKESQKRVKQRELRPINKSKKIESETRLPIKPSPRPHIRIKLQEALLSETTEAEANRCSNPLHKKKFKKLPKTSDLDNISATRPPQKQITERDRLRSNKDASICFSPMQKLDDEVTVSTSSEGIRTDSQKHYVTRIMNLAEISTNSLLSSASSHSLDPSIFSKLERLEENPSGSLALRCNRRLLFDLMNEILIETEKRSRNYHEPELINELCSAVERYSSKRFQAPYEIASIGVDHLLEKKKDIEEEGEEMVAEIERDIIDELVRETASDLSFLNRQ